MERLDSEASQKARKMTPLQQERRQRILVAARDLFRQKGFEKTNLDEVLAETGGSKQTLYRYFNDKKGLFHAVIASMSPKNGPSTDLLDVENAEESLIAYGLHYIRQATDPITTDAFRMVLGEARSQPELAAEFYTRNISAAKADLETYLEALRMHGVIAMEDVKLSADMLLGGLWGFIQMDSLFLSQSADDSALEARVRYVVRKFLQAHASEQ